MSGSARRACWTRSPSSTPRLRAVKETGTIKIDATTTLHGIPGEAWDYKLGNRSGLEWVLDQWKEQKISDPLWRRSSTPNWLLPRPCP